MLGSDSMTLMGQRIKTLRKSVGMTQQELGQKINVTKVSVCCYEKGTRIPSLDTLVDLSNVFNVSLDYFVGNDTFVVAEEDNTYGMKMAKEEIHIIEELRKTSNENIYNKLLNDPKRTLELINNRLR
jgi:transcriptional regulator with XRE-family HTH domain